MHTPHLGITLIYMHELAVIELDNWTLHVAQLVRALRHWNRRGAGSIPAGEPLVALFATAPG